MIALSSAERTQLLMRARTLRPAEIRVAMHEPREAGKTGSADTMSIERIKQAAVRRFKKAWEPMVHGIRTTGAKDGYVCRDILGSRMFLDVKDPGICRDSILYGIREEWAIGVMKDLLRPGQTVVDVGANIGFYVLLESLKVGPSGKVYAIEPVPDNYELLRRNVDLNQRGNIEMHRCAVGDKPGRAQMHLSHLRNWHAMTAVHATGRVIDVEVVTLDAFLEGKPSPSLVRMDVEGYAVPRSSRAWRRRSTVRPT